MSPLDVVLLILLCGALFFWLLTQMETNHLRARLKRLTATAIDLEIERNSMRTIMERSEQRTRIAVASHEKAASHAAIMVAERNQWERFAVAFARFELYLEGQISSNEPTSYDKDYCRAAAKMFNTYSEEILGAERFEHIKTREPIE